MMKKLHQKKTVKSKKKGGSSSSKGKAQDSKERVIKVTSRDSPKNVIQICIKNKIHKDTFIMQ